MDSEARLRCWLLLDQLPRVGPVTARKLVSACNNDVVALINADGATLSHLGLTPEQQAILKSPQLADAALAWRDQMVAQGGWLLHLEDERYPDRLKQIASAPLILYGIGNLEILSNPQIAIVGTRHPTYTGRENVLRLSRELVCTGLTITSGLALGIDGLAHQSALDAQGKTIAVLGAGFAHLYPKRHQALAVQIKEQGGLLLTEFAPQQTPLAENFPRRNRIISGLSLGVLVIEAAEKSGSLITAHYALEQGRELFAVPGAPQNSQALGCNRLIQQGAKLTLNAEDILSEITALYQPNIPSTAMSTPQQEIFDFNQLSPLQVMVKNSLDFSIASIDQVTERCGRPISEVISTLIELELLGVVVALDGGYSLSSRR